MWKHSLKSIKPITFFQSKTLVDYEPRIFTPQNTNLSDFLIKKFYLKSI